MWYDVIVVGGGPAGATTAAELASLGVEVLLLEKRRLPRVKACGGCLSPRVLKLLNFDLGEVLEDVTYQATFTYDSRTPVFSRSDRAMGYMVRRERFDQLLCEKARERGARLLTGQEVKRVEAGGEGVKVSTQDLVCHGRLVIGADGATGIVRRDLFPDHGPTTLVALEGRVTLPSSRLQALKGHVLIDLGSVPRGYAWAFPKEDHVNVGVMAPQRMARHLRGALARFLQGSPTLAGGSLQFLKGALIPIYDGSPKRIVGQQALLVGDAGSMVDPLLGEGICSAIQSAKTAARWAVRALEDREALLAYQTEIGIELEREFRPALQLSKLIYRFPRWSYHALKRCPRAVELYADILRGEAGYEDLLKRVKIHGLAMIGLGWLGRFMV